MSASKTTVFFVVQGLCRSKSEEECYRNRGFAVDRISGWVDLAADYDLSEKLTSYVKFLRDRKIEPKARIRIIKRTTVTVEPVVTEETIDETAG